MPEREPTQIEMMSTHELLREALHLAGAVAVGADHTPLDEMARELARRIEPTDEERLTEYNSGYYDGCGHRLPKSRVGWCGHSSGLCPDCTPHESENPE